MKCIRVFPNPLKHFSADRKCFAPEADQASYIQGTRQTTHPPHFQPGKVII